MREGEWVGHPPILALVGLVDGKTSDVVLDRW